MAIVEPSMCRVCVRLSKSFDQVNFLTYCNIE